MIEVKKGAIADFARDLLSVLDNFERAITSYENQENVNNELKNFIEGVKMVYMEMKGILKKYEIEEFVPVGESFNPYHSEAIAIEEVKKKVDADKVLEVFEKGYRMGEKIIRLAKVKVGQAKKEIREEIPIKDKKGKKQDN